MATAPPGPKGEDLGKLNYEFWRADMFGFLTALAERYGDVVGFDQPGQWTVADSTLRRPAGRVR